MDRFGERVSVRWKIKQLALLDPVSSTGEIFSRPAVLGAINTGHWE